MGKKKKQPGNENPKEENSPNKQDSDTALSFTMSQELKDEGNRLFQRRNYEGAMGKYNKALKLLPESHIEISYIRSNIAACYMQMGPQEFPNAIQQCNLALEVTPKYSKALLKRARCYEGMNRLDLALRDTAAILDIEPNNVVAVEVAERVKKVLEERGLKVTTDAAIELPPDYIEPESSSLKKKSKKKRSLKLKEEKLIKNEQTEENSIETKAEDKVVMEEQVRNIEQEQCQRNVKLVLGEDIRWARLPDDCSLGQVREVINDRFPGLGAVLVKYRDQDGDLITLTSDEELRWAEASQDPGTTLRLYLVEVGPRKDDKTSSSGCSSETVEKTITCVEDWVVLFARIFKNYAGMDSDEFLDLHELGIKVYSEAMEEMVTSEEAQTIFDMAAESFQEMTALALFKWGNVHLSRARKGIYMVDDDCPDDALSENVKNAYDYVMGEYKRAGMRYEEALKIKPDFHEGYLALGQEQFEQAKLSWYYAIGNDVDLETWPSTELLQLYNLAEDNIEKGLKLWEDTEEKRRLKDQKTNLGLGLDELSSGVSVEDEAEQASNMRSIINLIWGMMLYERSVVEFKLGLPVWSECLEVAIEKFELSGVSRSNIVAMKNNHCSNGSETEGIVFGGHKNCCFFTFCC